MPYSTSKQITADYKAKFKELLRRKAGELDEELEDLCAEAAWQSFGWQTLQELKSRGQQQKKLAFCQ
jgi:hypothetical protein